MVRRCQFSILLGAFVGCTANAGGSSGEPETADSVTTSATPEPDAASQTANTTGATNGQASSANVTEPGETNATGSEAGGAKSGSDAGDAKSGSDAGGAKSGITCDAREVNCERAEPTCDYGYVPRIVDGCFGECVRIDACVCSGPDQCPQHERYTCNNSRQRCTPYLN